MQTIMYPEWQGTAIPTIRGVLCEAVAAEIGEHADGSASWFGGTHPGFDVLSGATGASQIRRDAKSARVFDDRLEFTRTDYRPFDPEKVDIVTLVAAQVRTGYASTLGADGRIHLTATATVTGAWDVPVPVMNQLMETIAVAFEGRATRIVSIPLEDLKEFRVELSALPDTPGIESAPSRGPAAELVEGP